MTRNCFTLLITALASILAGCGGGGSSSIITPPPPPPPPAAPSISTVAPASVTLGVPLGGAEVWGANFNGSAQVLVDGQTAGYTTLISSSMLQVTLADSVSATVGTHQFTVQQNTGTSNASPFTVYAPHSVPTVMNALPAYLVGNEIGPPCVVLADVNGDGFADVLVTDWDDGQIYILDGNADGSLSPAQIISIPEAWAVAVADVNGDGIADLISISTDTETSTVSVLLGDGQGNFQPASSQQTVRGGNPVVVGVADIDGDGKPDLVLQTQPSGYDSLVWLKNKGNGNFATPVTLVPIAGFRAALADFNNDGKPDLLYELVNTSTGLSVFHLLVNNGGGNFTDQVAAGLGGFSGVPTAIDFNLDGIPDVVVPQAVGYPPTSFTLYSFRGNGDGSFTEVASLPVPDSGQFAVGDFDHDGFPDLAGPGLLFLFGDGRGNFTPLSIPGPLANFVAVGDINGDGIPDIVAADESDFVAVALGRTNRNFPAPLVLSSESWGNVELGDITGNGLPDILTGGINDPLDDLFLQGTVFLNQGNSSFGFGANVSINSFAMEDLTGKGVVDLIGSDGGNNLYIWPNNGTLSFSPTPVTIQTLYADGLIAVADMDGDGIPDIVTAGEILFGNGNYQFTPMPLGIGTQGFVVGDFTGNGRKDILSGNSVLLNMGNRNFQTVPTNVPQGYLMAVGDFNGDGKDDLVLSDGSDIFVIYYSNGDGTFYEATMLSLGGGAQAGSFGVGDFNNDGRLDLAVSVYPTNEMAMFFNQPGGQFTLSYFVAGTGAFSMAFGDLNNNGNLGIVLEPPPPFFPPTQVNVVFHQ